MKEIALEPSNCFHREAWRSETSRACTKATCQVGGDSEILLEISRFRRTLSLEVCARRWTIRITNPRSVHQDLSHSGPLPAPKPAG
jgi:hypothetical protein